MIYVSRIAERPEAWWPGGRGALMLSDASAVELIDMGLQLGLPEAVARDVYDPIVWHLVINPAQRHRALELEAQAVNRADWTAAARRAQAAGLQGHYKRWTPAP
jgi:hypothetical protein